MVQPEFPELLTLEKIQALAENAEFLMPLVTAYKEAEAKGDAAFAKTNGGCHNECCCPKELKFKFFLCNVWIWNQNAACEEDYVRPSID